jgi:hypothetical protein
MKTTAQNTIMASTLFTAGIILGITFLFIFFFSLLHKRGKQKALADQKSKFEQLVSASNLTINETEQFEHYLIAIDTLNAKLLYLNFSHPEEDARVIDLQKVKTARVEIEENSIYEEKKGKSVVVEKQISKLLLELTQKDVSQPKELLAFYQVHKDGMLDFNELKKRIEYWKENINNCLQGLGSSKSF